MLVDLTVKEFLNKVAGSDPVPGGGSIAALNGAVASALAAMPDKYRTIRETSLHFPLSDFSQTILVYQSALRTKISP